MKFNILKYHFLRNSLKGYRQILRTKSLRRVRDLKNSLADATSINVKSSSFTREVCIAHLPYEKIIRQYLYRTYINWFFINTYFYSIKREFPLIYPLPKKWLSVLKARGISVNYKLSTFLWYFSLLFLSLLNTSKSLLFLLKGFKYIGIPVTSDRYAFFSQLRPNNIPSSSCPLESYTVIDWYLQWQGRKNVHSIKHDIELSGFVYNTVNISQGYLPFLLINDIYTYFRLVRWYINYFFSSLLDLLSGKWWSLLLIRELLLAKAASFCPTKALANDYMFHYSELIYRPLWTYVVEAKGSRVITYFYSSYHQPTTNSVEIHDSESWPASTWKHFLVWDSYQKKYLETNLESNPKIESVGSIWFCDNNLSPTLPERSIAVFPIEFARLTYFMQTSAYGELRFEHPDYLKLFISDILSVLVCNSYKMVLKLKRERPSNQRSKYVAKYISQLKNNPNIIVVDSDISPLKLFSKCKGVISMPFTSTAHYTEIKSPNIYYDPVGWFDPYDSAAHGVPVISKKRQLNQWLLSNVID